MQEKNIKTHLCADLLLALLPLVLILFSASFFYSDTFYPFTRLGGINVSGMSAEEASAVICEAVQSQTLLLQDDTGRYIAEIPFSEWVDPEAVSASSLSALQDSHSAHSFWGWFFPPLRHYPVTLFSDISADRLSDVLQKYCYDNEAFRPPQNAKIVLGDSFWAVQPEDEGHSLNLSACLPALSSILPSITQLQNTVITVPAAYAAPELKTDSPKFLALLEQLDTLLSQKICIDFGFSSSIVLSPEQLYSAYEFTIQSDSLTALPSLERVNALVEILANEYAPSPYSAKYGRCALTRDIVVPTDDDKGWVLDQNALVDALFDALCSGENIRLTAAYDCTSYWKEIYSRRGLADTYLEISLSNQYFWFYLDGSCILESPVVTGCVADRTETREGCFHLSYRQANTWLSGPTWFDHVDYWMPFDGGIGLHDSSWRSEYGGDIYRTDGSHGCINTPLDAMATLFALFPNYGFIIVY